MKIHKIGLRIFHSIVTFVGIVAIISTLTSMSIAYGIASLLILVNGFILGVQLQSFDSVTQFKMKLVTYISLAVVGIVVFWYGIQSILLLAIGILTLSVETGFSAHTRFVKGEQPYQKYDWFPNNAIYFPLIPLRLAKMAYSKYIKN